MEEGDGCSYSVESYLVGFHVIKEMACITELV